MSGNRWKRIDFSLLDVNRFLGLNTVIAYQRAKVSAIKIVDHRSGGGSSTSSSSRSRGSLTATIHLAAQPRVD